MVAESVSALYSLERYHTQGRGFESGRYLFQFEKIELNTLELERACADERINSFAHAHKPRSSGIPIETDLLGGRFGVSVYAWTGLVKLLFRVVTCMNVMHGCRKAGALYYRHC